MPIDIYDKGFQNWLKGVFGLNTVRTALCECISGKLGDYVKDIPQSELKQFFCCLKTNQIYALKTQRKGVKKWKCIHFTCRDLMHRFVDNHTERHALNYKWKQQQSSSGDINNTDLGNDDNNLIWNIIVLYMQIGKNESTESYHSLESLDISHVIKVMRNCKLSSPDGTAEPFEEVLESRNRLMHSPTNTMDEYETRNTLRWARKLLDCLLISKETYYKDTIQYLDELAEKDFVIKYQSEECKHILQEVLKAKHVAVQLYQEIDDEKLHCKSQSKQLRDMLGKIYGVGYSENSRLEMEETEYKSIVNDTLVKKVDAIVNDKAEYDEKSEKYKDLEQLEQKTGQEIQILQDNSLKKKTEEQANEIEELKRMVLSLQLDKRKLQREVRENQMGNERPQANTRIHRDIDRDIGGFAGRNPHRMLYDQDTYEDSNSDRQDEEKENERKVDGVLVKAVTGPLVIYNGEGHAYPSLNLYFCYDDGIYSMTYRAKFIIANRKFWCVLQYIVFKLAETIDDKWTMYSILNCNNANKLKELERNFRHNILLTCKYDSLKPSIPDIAFEGNFAKFQQNEALHKQLLRTKSMALVYSSVNDTEWGIGLPIGHPDSFEKQKWKGSNELGEILTRIRNGEKNYDRRSACLIS